MEDIRNRPAFMAFSGNVTALSNYLESSAENINVTFTVECPSNYKSNGSHIPLSTPRPHVLRRALECLSSHQKDSEESRWLLSFGFRNSSLLHYGCIGNQLEVVNMLLNRGIDKELCNNVTVSDRLDGFNHQPNIDDRKQAEYYTSSDDILYALFPTQSAEDVRRREACFKDLVTEEPPVPPPPATRRQHHHHHHKDHHKPKPPPPRYPPVPATSTTASDGVGSNVDSDIAEQAKAKKRKSLLQRFSGIFSLSSSGKSSSKKGSNEKKELNAFFGGDDADGSARDSLESSVYPLPTPPSRRQSISDKYGNKLTRVLSPEADAAKPGEQDKVTMSIDNCSDAVVCHKPFSNATGDEEPFDWTHLEQKEEDPMPSMDVQLALCKGDEALLTTNNVSKTPLAADGADLAVLSNVSKLAEQLEANVVAINAPGTPIRLSMATKRMSTVLRNRRHSTRPTKMVAGGSPDKDKPPPTTSRPSADKKAAKKTDVAVLLNTKSAAASAAKQLLNRRLEKSIPRKKATNNNSLVPISIMYPFPYTVEPTRNAGKDEGSANVLVSPIAATAKPVISTSTTVKSDWTYKYGNGKANGVSKSAAAKMQEPRTVNCVVNNESSDKATKVKPPPPPPRSITGNNKPPPPPPRTSNNEPKKVKPPPPTTPRPKRLSTAGDAGIHVDVEEVQQKLEEEALLQKNEEFLSCLQDVCALTNVVKVKNPGMAKPRRSKNTLAKVKKWEKGSDGESSHHAMMTRSKALSTDLRESIVNTAQENMAKSIQSQQLREQIEEKHKKDEIQYENLIVELINKSEPAKGKWDSGGKGALRQRLTSDALMQESLNKDTERKSERRRRQSVVTMPFNSSVAGRNGKGESVTSCNVIQATAGIKQLYSTLAPVVNADILGLQWRDDHEYEGTFGSGWNTAKLSTLNVPAVSPVKPKGAGAGNEEPKPKFRDVMWKQMDIGANETQFGIGSDPILDLMKNFASQKGEAMLSKEFGPYSNPDAVWEGLKIKHSQQQRLQVSQQALKSLDKTQYRRFSAAHTTIKCTPGRDVRGSVRKHRRSNELNSRTI